MSTEQRPEKGEDGRPNALDTVVDVPIDVRRVSLAIMAVATIVFMLRYAWEILLPVVGAILISYAFDPIVTWLARRRIPRAIGAALVLGAFAGGAVYGVYSLRDDALAIVEDLPASAKKLRRSMRQLQGDKGAVQTLSEAVAEIEKTAQAGAGASPVAPGVTRVQVEEKPLDVMQYLWWGSMGAVGLGSRAVMVVFLAFFLLASGDLYRRKLVKIVGPTLSRKRVTVQILQEINTQIERFLFVQLVTSVLVALASSLAFHWLGLERALFWGVVAGLLNSIPYFGPVIVMAGVGALAFLQFGSLDKTFGIAAVSLAITSLEGFLLTPYLLGRRLRMNGAAVFVGLLFWGWVWGVWGMLLAAPMMVVIKSVCDHVEDLRGFGDMLGE
jgi:predicted PurR-regulated permease PerM